MRYTLAALAVDVCAGVVAAALALFLRFGHGLPMHELSVTPLASLVRFGHALPTRELAAALAWPVLWVVLVAVNRTYQRHLIGVGTEEFSRVLRAGIGLVAVVSLASYGTKAQLSRGFVVLALTAVVLLSLIGRVVLRTLLGRYRARGRCVQLVMLIGSAETATEMVKRLRTDPSHGLTVVAVCVTDLGSDRVHALQALGVPMMNDLGRIEALVRLSGADVVVVLPSASITGDELRRMTWQLEGTGAELSVCTGLSEVTGQRVTIRPAGFTPLVAVAPARLSGLDRVVKGAFDRCAALLGLVVIAPVLCCLAGAIWLGDRSNPLFSQTRVGRNGREFQMLKLRTMVPDAEARKDGLLDRNESDGALFKIANDPRVTPIGKWLRRHSLDELPQLINVVRGEMSLVGPRPPLPCEVEHYGADMRRRLLVKPGITGLWQVSGRSSLSWAETQMLDIRYVENWSLSRDVAILWRTAHAVFSGAGAH